MVSRAADPDVVFLTGDLGFMALEPLAEALGERFINAGVSEQNMVTVGAALARLRFEVWVYSIAPFCYARPFEQIRNDVAFHRLRVRLVGNGGGFGYGVMGPTHHAVEDYGILLTLPGMTVIAPTFNEDVPAAVDRAAATPGPAYLRLGRGEAPDGFSIPAYAPWRQLVAGEGPVVIALGPLAGSYIAVCRALAPVQRPNLWALAELPIERNPPPHVLVEQAHRGGGVFVAEEHVRQGGVAGQLALYCAEMGIGLPRFRSLHAPSQIFERYGSQQYLRAAAHLDPAGLLSVLQA